MGDKRLDIKTGFICNNNCRFCVQAQNKPLGNRTTEEIKKDLEESRKRCKDIVFTGGEVTIRKDIFELVSYAKKLGYRTIQIQSNCRMCSYIPFLKELIKAGANEFGPAIHGHNTKLQDYLTRSLGSFNQTVKAIKNLRELGQKIITNTVVVKPNYKHLAEIAKLLVKLKVDQFQFAFVHPMGNAYKYYNEMVPKMSLAAPYIHKGLQIGIDAGVRVMAEAMPYCMMKGYEKYISERVIPDTEVKTGFSFDSNHTNTRVKEGKAKFPQCKKCKYDKICEGPWKEYPEKFGNWEFRPVKHVVEHDGTVDIPKKRRENRKKLLNFILSEKFYSQLPEFISLNEGIKDSVRFITRLHKYGLLKNFFRGLGFYIEKSAFKVLTKKDTSCERIPMDDPRSDDISVYISRYEADAKRLAYLHSVEELSDSREMGKLLGYPECCIDFYVNGFLSQIGHPDFTFASLRNTKGKCSFLLNNLFWDNTLDDKRLEKNNYFYLISNFPCSFNCEKSKQIGKRVLKAIRKYDEYIAEEIEKKLKNAVVYRNKADIDFLAGKEKLHRKSKRGVLIEFF